jgi:Ca2+-binding EF-hand superfamily protein
MMEEMSLFDEIKSTEEKIENLTKEEKVKILFKEMDLKKNGKIDLSEFQEWWWSRESNKK